MSENREPSAEAMEAADKLWEKLIHTPGSGFSPRKTLARALDEFRAKAELPDYEKIPALRAAADVVQEIVKPKISTTHCRLATCLYNGYSMLDRHLCTHPACPIAGTPGNRMKLANSESIINEEVKPGFPD